VLGNDEFTIGDTRVTASELLDASHDDNVGAPHVVVKM
jgi:hypothetical protein